MVVMAGLGVGPWLSRSWYVLKNRLHCQATGFNRFSDQAVMQVLDMPGLFQAEKEPTCPGSERGEAGALYHANREPFMVR